MQPNTVLEMARDGQPKAIAALLTRSIGASSKVQALFQAETLLIRIASAEDLEQSSTLETIQTVLHRLDSPKISQCQAEFYALDNKELQWAQDFSVVTPAAVEALPLEQVPDLAAEAVPATVVPDDDGAIQPAPQAKTWGFPGVNLAGLGKLGGQVAQQATKVTQETAVNAHGMASKATEQALRSSIDQTMNAFQIAVEQIHERKLPAKMTALTGTINVGVVQLSIRLDIPMDEETGNITVEAKPKDV